MSSSGISNRRTTLLPISKRSRSSNPWQEFPRLVAELNRLVSTKGYSQGQIASEVGVSPITVNRWCKGYALTAKPKSVERLKTFLAYHYGGYLSLPRPEASRIFLAPRQRLKNYLVFVGSGNMPQESL
jgi:hypothetical protein